MSYLIRCDICGKEIADTSYVRRIEIRFETTDVIMGDGVRHVCVDCLDDFRRILSVLEKRKEE